MAGIEEEIFTDCSTIFRDALFYLPLINSATSVAGKLVWRSFIADFLGDLSL